MYYLATATANKHVAERGPAKGKVVENDAYTQVANGPTSFQQAMDRVLHLIGTSKPGTKIKLVVTVPKPAMTTAEELVALKNRIAELEGHRAAPEKSLSPAA